MSTQLHLISQLFILTCNLQMLLSQSSPPTMQLTGVQHLIDAAACVHQLHGLLCLKDGVSQIIENSVCVCCSRASLDIGRKRRRVESNCDIILDNVIFCDNCGSQHKLSHCLEMHTHILLKKTSLPNHKIGGPKILLNCDCNWKHGIMMTRVKATSNLSVLISALNAR